MSAKERLATFSLALVYGFRMLGLFMILPVFSLYAHQLVGATPFLTGVAMGVYGLTQASLQIPLGILSDKIGRKPVIIAGLLIFATGSIIAALSSSIGGVILGRALQGAGAISSATMALLTDVTRDEHRTKAMAFIGMFIGISFAAAIVLGPVIHQLAGISGIFFVSAGLCAIGILLVLVLIPPSSMTPSLPQAASVWCNAELWKLSAGVFIQHAVFTGTFLVLPLLLAKAGLATTWYFYLPIILLAFMACLPLIIVAEAKRKMYIVLHACILGLLVAECAFGVFHAHLTILAIALFVFFTAFTTLEAVLPSLTSKLAPLGAKGAAMGMYATAQFSGIFFGGLIAGFLYQHFAISIVIVAQVLFLIAWRIMAAQMSPHVFKEQSNGQRH